MVNEQVWPSVFLIICFALIVVIYLSSFSRVAKVVQSCFNIQTLRQLEREEYNPFKFYSVSMAILFLFNVTFFVFKINSIYKIVFKDYSSFTQFLIFLGIITLMFILKNLSSKLLSIFINDNKFIPEYSFSSYTMNQTMALFIFPCMVLAELSPFNSLMFLSAAAVLMGAMQVLKLYRGLVFTMVENRIGILQIFAYFCGLEVLPILVLVKLIIEKF